VVERLDELGKPAWIAAMVLGFIVFWPVGLLILGYLLWSGRMACGRDGQWGRMSDRWQRKMRSWGEGPAFRPTGNRAFDEYREETLKRLEDEAAEFKSFLDRLRMAKDKAEFDQFMSDRRGRSGGTDGGEPRPV
jgi:hypothetical protein